MSLYMYTDICIYSPSLQSLSPLAHNPTPLGHHRAPGWAPCAAQQLLASCLFCLRECIQVSATFSVDPTLSFPHCAHKSVLYVCIPVVAGFLLCPRQVILLRVPRADILSGHHRILKSCVFLCAPSSTLVLGQKICVIFVASTQYARKQLLNGDCKSSDQRSNPG